MRCRSRAPTPHFEPDDPSPLDRRPLTRRGTNPVITPEKPEGCAPKAQQPSGSYLNTGTQLIKSDTGDDGSPMPMGTGDRPGFEDTVDHFEAREVPSRNVNSVAGETRDRKSIARDILAEAGFTEDRIQKAARDRYERKTVNWYS
jgi:hypothetical protein